MEEIHYYCQRNDTHHNYCVYWIFFNFFSKNQFFFIAYLNKILFFHFIKVILIFQNIIISRFSNYNTIIFIF